MNREKLCPCKNCENFINDWTETEFSGRGICKEDNHTTWGDNGCVFYDYKKHYKPNKTKGE